MGWEAGLAVFAASVLTMYMARIAISLALIVARLEYAIMADWDRISACAESRRFQP